MSIISQSLQAVGEEVVVHHPDGRMATDDSGKEIGAALGSAAEVARLGGGYHREIFTAVTTVLERT